MALGKEKNQLIVANTIENTSVNIIHITEDKLENILIKRVDKIKKSRDWLGALCFGVSIFTTLLTADFHETFGLDGFVFKAIYIIFLGASIITVFATAWRAITQRVRIKDIISDIKNEKN